MVYIGKVRILLVLLSVLFSLGCVFSYSVTNSMSYPIKYFSVNDINNPTIVGGHGSINPGQTLEILGDNFYYSADNRFAYMSTGEASGTINIQRGHYNSLGINTGTNFNWLDNGICIPSDVSITGARPNYQVSMRGNFLWQGYTTTDAETQVANYHNFLQSNIPSVLTDNYYMNVKVVAQLMDSVGPVPGGEYPQNFKIKPMMDNYVLTSVPDDSQIDSAFGPGDYYWRITITPIDLKCDFSGDGTLQNNERTIFTRNLDEAFTIINDQDNDGVPDASDLCPTEPGHTEFQGCPYEYTSLGCSGASFNPETRVFRCNYDNAFCDDAIRFNRNSASLSGSWRIDDNTMSELVTLGSGYYLCEDVHSLFCINESLDGYCQIRDNKVTPTTPNFCAAFGEYFANGYHRFYQYERVPQGKSCDAFSSNFNCGGTDAWFPDPTYTQYKYTRCFVDESFDTTGTKINSDGTWEVEDDYDLRKVVYDPVTSNTYFVNSDLIREPIIMPTIALSKTIKIYKNDVHIRDDIITPEYIAMKAHQIQKFVDVADAQEFVAKSYNLMSNLNIEKRVDNLSSPGNSRIKIELDIPTAYRINVTVYQVIPKGISYDDINFINDGGAQVIVLEKDPVIGWHFNESDGDETIEYEIPGEGEGGTIIITQEPILFNEGELVINYRETNCNPGEAQLFELDDLIESSVYSPGSGRTYKVCVAHLTEDLEANSNNLFEHIFNFTHAGNMSLTQMMNIPVDISVDNSTPIYWDMKVQMNNPDGTYSCLGSFANEDDSLFGDCGYTIRRIWLHLGDDIVPPNTTLSYPYIAHKMRVELSAEDDIGGSGIDETYYCVEEGGVDCSNSGDFKIYNGNFFLVTCEEDWGCVKNIYYYSTDIEGNVEPTNVYELTLIDKGSACQVDCTAKPKPNRYLKECRNLNGCEYFPAPWEVGDERGEHVAEQCHYMIEGSWVGYNESHEVKCPLGPFRPKMFTSLSMLLTSLTCENMIVVERNVLLNGESVKMKIVFCEDDY